VNEPPGLLRTSTAAKRAAIAVAVLVCLALLIACDARQEKADCYYHPADAKPQCRD